MAPNGNGPAVPADAAFEPTSKPVAEIKFEMVAHRGGTLSRRIVPLYADKTLKFGRDACSNDFTPLGGFELSVSRNHLEFYAVVFEEGSNHFPLVYVRDRQSNNGTKVNNEVLSDGKSITPARLLQHGDKVTISPNVEFELIQPFIPKLKLSRLQSEEVKVFADRYIVTDRTIGEGASARVHLAIDRQTREQVACKVYDLHSMDKSGQDETMRRLLQETYIRCQMEHPNIASFRGAYKSRHTLYVFEDLATGGDLFSLMMRESRFSESDVRWMMRQIVRAVAYMHEKGVVHRDLKPENILCAICPKPGHRLVITDFGHSGVVSQGRMKGVVGTRGWQAPELLKPQHDHGPPVDMWSIGVLAAQLLAGPSTVDNLALLGIFARWTYHKREATQLMKRIFEDVVKARSASISEDAKDFIRRCLRINPETRVTAADAMEHPWLCKPDEDLQSFLQREMETTASWKRREVLGSVVKELPDLRQKITYGSPFFTLQEARPSHAVRRTAEYKKKRAGGKTKVPRKCSVMQDISMVPHFHSLEQRLIARSKGAVRKSQEQLLKKLTQSGKMFLCERVEHQDRDDHASKPSEA